MHTTKTQIRKSKHSWSVAKTGIEVWWVKYVIREKKRQMILCDLAKLMSDLAVIELFGLNYKLHLFELF